MCITLKKKPLTFTYYITNNALEWVDTFMYLGILVDNRLKWQALVEWTVLKASQVLNLLRRTMKDCSMDAKKKAYTALVRPLLEYAAPTKKCNAMCITRKKKPPTLTYYINNNALEWVDTFKYLGILVDNRLK